MRVLLLPDREFLQHERAMLARLEIGLADEGHRVLHGVPASAVDGGIPGETPAVYSTPVTYADTGFPFTRGLRAQAFLEAIRAAAPPEGSGSVVDVVHVFGREAWDVALKLARRTRAAVLLEVFEASAIGPAVECAALNRSVRLVAADGPLGDELIRRVGEQRVYIAPWGVHLADRAHDDEQVARGTGTLTLALLSTGQDGAGLRAAVRGAAVLAAQSDFVHRGVMLFIDSQVARQQPVWRWAEEAGLAGRLSVIADLEGRRETVLQADVLQVADATGRQRSFLLDAMAAGMLIVARSDAMNSTLVDGVTCRIVAEETDEGWGAALGTILGPDHAAVAKQLGESARAFVRSERLASRHVAAVLAAYAKLATPAGVSP